MSAQPTLEPSHPAQPTHAASAVNAAFVDYLPAIERHAAIQFRGLPDNDKQEAIAEARAAAFVNFRSAFRNGRAHRLKPSTVARYAALHVVSERRVGGRPDNTTDVLSPKAQRTRGFKVHSLPWDSEHAYDILKAPEKVWRLALLDDRRTPVLDQVRIRIDLSRFMSKQSDRMRTVMAMLAAGHLQNEVADRIGCTPSAICQRLRRARQEWERFQGEDDGSSPSRTLPASG